MVSDIVHEGLGHAAIALLTGAKSGMLSTVAWSSDFETRLVAAGGTLANLAAGLIFWLALRNAKNASARWRYFLVISFAFNVFSGTGYFLFSGVCNFGDWAEVIAGLPAHAVWRTVLLWVGVLSYFGAVLAVGIALVRYLGVARNQLGRLRKLTWVPYFSSIVLLSAAGMLNPIGIELVWQSALPASAGAKSGLLWLRYYIPKGTVPEGARDGVARSYAWITVAAAATLVFIFALGRGIVLRR
jgi:hypothetical protein